jgi:hypothetical protein
MALNWRGNEIEGWEARASRPVPSGKYEIRRSKDKDGISYNVTHRNAWDERSVGSSGFPTLEAAKAAAEQDNGQRLATTLMIS